MRVAEPESIQQGMRWYRLGLAELPQGYIDFHRDLAMASLESMKAEYVVHKVWMEPDAWMIVQEVNAIVEKKGTSVLHKIHWHPGNQGWMVRLPNHCGSAIFRP